MPEKIIARLMRGKGYKYGCQFTIREGSFADSQDFGAPLYFKSQDEIDPFKQSNGLEVLWIKPVEELV